MLGRFFVCGWEKVGSIGLHFMQDSVSNSMKDSVKGSRQTED